MDIVSKDSSIDELMLTVRSWNALMGEGIDTIGKLIAYTEREIFRLPSIGRKTIKDINGALSDIGLSLKKDNKSKPITKENIIYKDVVKERVVWQDIIKEREVFKDKIVYKDVIKEVEVIQTVNKKEFVIQKIPVISSCVICDGVPKVFIRERQHMNDIHGLVIRCLACGTQAASESKGWFEQEGIYPTFIEAVMKWNKMLRKVNREAPTNELLKIVEQLASK